MNVGRLRLANDTKGTNLDLFDRPHTIARANLIAPHVNPGLRGRLLGRVR
jgi:hypothetical protein